MEQFFKLVDDAIEFSKNNRRCYGGISLELLAKQICTVHINLGRGTGKSSYIHQRSSKNDLIVVPNYHKKEEMLKRGNSSTILTPMEIERTLRGNALLFDNIWIDEPKMCFSRNIEDRIISLSHLYFLCAKNVDQTYILLGE